MKKITFILLFIMIISLQTNAKDFNQFCTAPKTESNSITKLSNISGINKISKKIIEYEISKKLQKELNADFEVKILNNNNNNILNGEFEKLIAKSDNINLKGFYMSDVYAETICNYNHITYKNKQLNFAQNFVLKFNSTVTQDDMNKTTSSEKYTSIINKINSDKLISSMLKISDSKINIDNDKLILSYKLQPIPGLNFLIKPINLKLSGKLEAQDGKIKLTNTHIVSKRNYTVPEDIIEMLNPLEYDIKVSKNKKAQLYMDNVEIIDNKIKAQGIIFIEKD